MGDTLGQLEAEVLINTLADALAKAKAKTRRDSLRDVEVKALLNTLAKTHTVDGQDTLLHTRQCRCRRTSQYLG